MTDVTEQTIADGAVLTKYRLAGEIVNRTLKKLLDSFVDGSSLRNICIEGDKILAEELAKVLKKDKDITRGIAFPVSISVNNCINHYSPLLSEDDTTLKTGDMVKVDFGAHLDGFIAVVAHTIVIGASVENRVTGRKADVMLAAHYSAQAALGLFKAGTQNTAVTDAVGKLAETFGCCAVDGMLSFQLQQNRIDGEKMIQQTSSSTQRKDFTKSKIGENDVYGMDVVISTGKGQGREMDSRVTIYKKTEEVYSLKLKCSREFFRKVTKEHSVMPFNLRDFDDEKKARMGVKECVTHKLVSPYPVLWEKQGESVAQFKYTVLVLPTGPQKVTGLPFDVSLYTSQYKLEDNAEAQALVQAASTTRKKNKKKAPAAAEKTASAAAPKE